MTTLNSLDTDFIKHFEKDISKTVFPPNCRGQAWTYQGKIFCQYDDSLYLYDQDKDLWTEYTKNKVEETMEDSCDSRNEDVLRLENRNDMLETEVDNLTSENKRLSMRLRRLEIQSDRRDKQYGASQDFINKALAIAIGSLSGFVVWGYGGLDFIKSLF